MQLTWYIYNTRSQFNNCWVIVVYRVTIHNNFSKCPPPASRQAWTRQIVDCGTLSKLPGWLQIVWQAPRVRKGSVSSFSNWSWIPWVLSLRDWGQVNVRAVPRILFADIYSN